MNTPERTAIVKTPETGLCLMKESDARFPAADLLSFVKQTSPVNHQHSPAHFTVRTESGKRYMVIDRTWYAKEI